MQFDTADTDPSRRPPDPAPGTDPAATADATLARWIAEEDAIRRGWEAAAPRPRDPAASGLAQMQALLRGEAHRASMGETLDFLLVAVGDGRAVFQGRPGPRLLNPMGSVHGGWFAALLDSALGCAVHSTLPPGRAYTTADLQVRMVRAIPPGLPRVRAEAWTVHRGRQLVTAEARLAGPDGRLYAHASAGCLVLASGRDGAPPAGENAPVSHPR